MMRYTLCWAILWAALSLAAQPLVSGAAADPLAVSLWTVEGRAATLGKLAGGRPVVAIYLNSECPISQKYTRTLSELAKAWPGVVFVGVFTRWEGPLDMKRFAAQYRLAFPMVLDNAHKLLRALGARVTPEAFLLSPRGEVLYRGAIDNWFYALGRNRPRPTETWLRDAIGATLGGKEVAVKETEAVGCVIEQ